MSVIVVIEDDEQLRSLLVEWLTAEGHRVNVTVADARRADGLIATMPTADLLIVALIAPLSRGVERLRRARCAHPGAPIVATSAQLHPGVDAATAAAEALEVDRVVAKPFEREALLGVVRSLIGKPH